MLNKLITAAFFAVAGTAAVAVPITITPHSTKTGINAALDSLALGVHAFENFESFGSVSKNQTVAFESDKINRQAAPGVRYGELTSAGIQTAVGTITTHGNLTGSGGTCRGLDRAGDKCSNIALQYDPDLHGQGNIAPVDGKWSLNAADAGGFVWLASSPLVKEFSKMIFALRDAADTGATVTVSTEVDGVVYTESMSRLGNNNLQLIEIDFSGTRVSSAEITIASSRKNDSMTIDGMMLVAPNRLDDTPPSAIPLPSTGLMLLGALGAAGLGRRALKKRA